MSKQIQEEKINLALEKIGKILLQQRTIILKKEYKDFCEHINSFSNTVFTEEIVKNMEEGKEVSILYWFSIWLYFQNLDKIIQAYDIKEMMFLAQQEFIPTIEQEILAYHKNK